MMVLRPSAGRSSRCALLLLLAAAAAVVCGCPFNDNDTRTALSILYRSTNGDSWLIRSGWLSSAPVCQWYGVGNVDNNMTLDLSRNNLTGTLPTEFANLSSPLIWFRISGNNVGGTLPSVWSAARWARTIHSFDVSLNRLEGALPEEYNNWANLRDLSCNGNELSGTLPNSYAQWVSLGGFNVGSNRFNGTLPSDFSRWRLLTQLNVGDNNFSGTLPASYGSSFMALKNLNASTNRLSGSLPEEFGSWVNITQFSVNHNSLSGTLPPKFSSWTKIDSFVVAANFFTGTLPPEYSVWGASIDYFRAYENQLNGTLPSEYQAWTSLQILDIRNNDLTGTLPPGYASWRQLHSINVAFNGLTSSIPSSYVQWSNLMMISLSHNRFSGPFPVFLTILSNLQFAVLQYNEFSGTLPNVGQRNRRLFLLAIDNNHFTGTVPISFLRAAIYVFLCNLHLCSNTPLPGPQGSFVSTTDCPIFSLADGSMPIMPFSTTLDLPPCPPAADNVTLEVPTRRTSQHSAAAVAYGVGVAAAVSSVGSPAAALSIRRLALLLTSDQCRDGLRMKNRTIDVTNAPLQLNIGPVETGGMHRGAVVGNVVCVALASVAGAAAVAVRRRRGGGGWWRNAGALKLPGAVASVVSLLYQQTAVSSAVLVSARSAAGWGAADAALGAVGLFVCCAWVGALVWLLVVNFCGEGVVVDPVRAGDAAWRRALSWAVAPRVQWRAAVRRGVRLHCGKWFVECYGLLFRGSSVRREWWLVADVGVTFALSLLAGIASDGGSMGCSVRRWIAVVMFVIVAGTVVLLRPQNRHLSWASAVLSSINACVLAVYSAAVTSSEAGDSEAWLEVLTMAVSAACGTATAVVMVGNKVLSMQRRQAELTGASVPPAEEKTTAVVAASSKRKHSGQQSTISSEVQRLDAPEKRCTYAQEVERARCLRELVFMACRRRSEPFPLDFTL